MDMTNWLNAINANGGKEKVACLCFDNMRTFTLDPAKTFDEQITLDATNDVWVMKERQAYAVNDHQVETLCIEANESLQQVTMVTKLEDKAKWRFDKTY